MPRYLVATRRSERDTAVSAHDAVASEPDIQVLNANDPHMVTIEADPQVAEKLQQKLKGTYIVEPEIRRGLT